MTSTTPQHITLAEAKDAARKAYGEKRLLSQSTETEYGYLVNGYVCAIGAGLTRETLGAIEDADLGKEGIPLSAEGDIPIESFIAFDEIERRGLNRLQHAHDAWFTAVLDGVGDDKIQAAEAGFVSLLGA